MKVRFIRIRISGSKTYLYGKCAETYHIYIFLHLNFWGINWNYIFFFLVSGSGSLSVWRISGIPDPYHDSYWLVVVQDTRDCWVDGISHLVLSLGTLSHQKEYELFLKTSFRKADENSSGYLSLAEVITVLGWLRKRILKPSQNTKILSNYFEFCAKEINYFSRTDYSRVN